MISTFRKRLSCWIYLIRKFPDRLLNQPLLEEYRNTPERRYCERSERVATVASKDDLDYGI